MVSRKLHINWFGKRVHSFHFFGVMGYILGTVLGVFLSSQLNLRVEIVLLMAGIGAATFFGLTYLSKWIAGGETIVYYHHEISILVLCTLTLYFLRLPILPYLDITLLGIGVFLAFGRIGCYSVGCCHGRPHKHGVKYGQQHVDAGFTWFYKDVPLFPVQLIESAYVFITIIVGSILLLNHVVPGTVLVCYTVIYGMMRYMLEFFRGDPERPLWLGISEAQWTTLALIAISFGMSLLGWLPRYDWHLWILIIITIISMIIILYYRKNANYFLFNPPHVKQMAIGLEFLNSKRLSASPANTKEVTIYSTREGLSLSTGDFAENKSETKHYTVSFRIATVMNKELAIKIGRLIAELRKHSGRYELIEKQKGIYHILFKPG